MSSELLVMTFPHPSDARTVIKAIRTMRKSPILSLDSVVVVTKGRKGEIAFLPRQGSAAVKEDRDKQILLNLADLILCTGSTEVLDAIIARGMDVQFIREIALIMEDESSALFILNRENSIYDPDTMRSTLALFKGKIHQTSLFPEVEAYLSTAP